MTRVQSLCNAPSSSRAQTILAEFKPLKRVWHAALQHLRQPRCTLILYVRPSQAQRAQREIGRLATENALFPC